MIGITERKIQNIGDRHSVRSFAIIEYFKNFACAGNHKRGEALHEPLRTRIYEIKNIES